MIGDREIDLTQGMKFGRPSISIGVEKKLPWESLKTNYRQKRKYGDYVSDNFGIVVRRGSDGKWWFAESVDKIKRFDLVFEEYLYEELGYIPGHPFQRCFCCGRFFFSNGPIECPECRVASLEPSVLRKLFTKPVYGTTDRIRTWGLIERLARR